jgi:hypothetical protein
VPLEPGPARQSYGPAATSAPGPTGCPSRLPTGSAAAQHAELQGTVRRHSVGLEPSMRSHDPCLTAPTSAPGLGAMTCATLGRVQRLSSAARALLEDRCPPGRALRSQVPRLRRVATGCNGLPRVATQPVATNCNAARCNGLCRVATRCAALQRTATQHAMLQHGGTVPARAGTLGATCAVGRRAEHMLTV